MGEEVERETGIERWFGWVELKAVHSREQLSADCQKVQCKLLVTVEETSTNSKFFNLKWQFTLWGLN
jgi:hypothetical protein